MATETSASPRALRPLRVHLLLLVLGAMLPGTLLTTLLVSSTLSSSRRVVERRLLDSARVDAAALDHELESTMLALEVLAGTPLLDDGDLQGFYNEARRLHLAHQDWHSILLVTPGGKQVVNTRVPWGAPLVEAPEPNSVARLLRTRRPEVGLVRDAPYGSVDHLFPVRVPVLRHGKMEYGLIAMLETDLLSRLVSSQLPLSEEWTRMIIDPAGTIAARTRDAVRYVGQTLGTDVRGAIRASEDHVFRTVGVDGAEVYVAACESELGWTAAVMVPSNVLDAPVQRSTAALIVGGVLLMASGLAAVLVLSRRLTRDFTSVARAAEALAGGFAVPEADVRVAETRQLHDSLRAAASLLETREHERDREVERAEAARAEAERANRTKDEFLAVLGHELRNPLTPAMTVLELLRRREPGLIRRERQILERQIGQMARLVNDLLDVSRLAHGKVELVCRRFDLRAAVDRAIDMARPLIDRSGHELRVDVPAEGLSLLADEDRIVQVLGNLLTNAAKFTPPGGHLGVVARTDGEAVTIVCEDDGPGVPAELVPKLFDAFTQAPQQMDRHLGGLGLGLALARSLTELHGGTLRYEDRHPEAGSRFVVRLPLVAPCLQEPAQ